MKKPIMAELRQDIVIPGYLTIYKGTEGEVVAIRPSGTDVVIFVKFGLGYENNIPFIVSMSGNNAKIKNAVSIRELRSSFISEGCKALITNPSHKHFGKVVEILRTSTEYTLALNGARVGHTAPDYGLHLISLDDVVKNPATVQEKEGDYTLLVDSAVHPTSIMGELVESVEEQTRKLYPSATNIKVSISFDIVEHLEFGAQVKGAANEKS